MLNKYPGDEYDMYWLTILMLLVIVGALVKLPNPCGGVRK